MTFNIQELPSGGVYFQGKLTQKKLTAKAKRQVLLCFPTSIHDIQLLQKQLKTSDHDMDILGHLSLACISG